MCCRTAIRLMTRRLEEALSPREEAALDSHLERCPRCRVFWQQMEQVQALLRPAPQVEPPPGLADRIVARIPERRRSVVPAPPAWAQAGVLVGAAVALLLVLGLVVISAGAGLDRSTVLLLWRGGRDVFVAVWNGAAVLATALGEVLSVGWRALRWPWGALVALLLAFAAAGAGALWWWSGRRGG